MFDSNEKILIIKALTTTIEVCGGRQWSDEAILTALFDLYQNGAADSEILLAALSRLRVEFSGNLNLKVIFEQYQKLKEAFDKKNRLSFFEQKNEDEEAKRLRKIENSKCFNVFKFMQNSSEFAEKMNNTKRLDGESFRQKAHRILSENKHLKEQAVSFFSKNSEKTNVFNDLIKKME